MPRVPVLIVLVLALIGCAPLIRVPTSDIASVSGTQGTPSGDKTAVVAANPGKIVLVVVGVFSALLVLLYVLVGNDLGGN